MIEAIPIPTITVLPSLGHAARLLGMIEEKEYKIRELEAEALAQVAAQIEALRQDADQMRREHDTILADCVAAGKLEEGIYVIKAKSRTTRVINVERFRKAFPKEFDILATIPVQKAETLIGKMHLSAYCDLIHGPETYELGFRFKEARG